MAEPVISVVMPTRDRCAVLAKTLEALARQVGVPGPFEVIVVDDGSTDATRNLLRSVHLSGFTWRSILLDRGGPARARNRGISVAAGERILLLGDDTIPEPDCVAKHAAADSDTGIQGMIDWDPDVGITDVMRFLAPEGPQFWFKELTTGSTVPWPSVVSSNLSAPKRWFLDEPFDEGFPAASMEDTELAWRWSRRGWEVVFVAGAGCIHRHRYDDIRKVLVRQRCAGRWARRAVRLHLGLLYPIVVRPLLLAPLIAVRGGARALLGRNERTWRWDLRCRLAFIVGFVTGRESR